MRHYGIDHELAAKLERRYRLSWDNRALLLRVLAREMDRLIPLVEKEKESNQKNSTWEKDTEYLLKQTTILAMTLGEDRETGGRRTTWIWDRNSYTSDWCRKKADELEKMVKKK